MTGGAGIIGRFDEVGAGGLDVTIKVARYMADVRQVATTAGRHRCAHVLTDGSES